jgi:hypothetical protein
VGEEVVCDDPEACAKALAQASSGVPFYVQHMVQWMTAETETPWTAARVRRIPEQLFRAAGDPVNFHYYESRLAQHYTEDVAERAIVLLDVLCREKRGLPFDEWLNLMRHHPPTQTIDPESALATARTLRDDHYLVQEADRWRFKLEIVRRWWAQRDGG